MTPTPPPSDGPAFDAMFTASLAGMRKVETRDQLRAALQAVIDGSGLSHDDVATVLGEMCDEAGAHAE